MGVWRASPQGRSTRAGITEDMLRVLRAEGITCAEMAKRLDIPLGTVGTLLTKYGLSRRRGSKKATTDMPKPKVGKYDHVKTEDLKALRDEGLIIPDISKRLGIPRSSLEKLLHDRGLVDKTHPRSKPEARTIRRERAPNQSGEYSAEPLVFPPITPEIRKAMRKHYEKMPRTVLARQLGIPKTLLIHYALQLGLKSGGVQRDDGTDRN